MKSEVARKEFQVPVPWGFVAGVAWGEESGFPVLCLHGIQDNANSFALLVPHLPKRFFYVAIDFPGHGRSSTLAEGFPIEFNHLVFAVKMVVEHFKWNKLYIIGHSMGAHVSSLFVALNPQTVVKAVFLDGLFPNEVPTDEYVSSLKEKFKRTKELVNSTLNKLPPSYSHDEALYRLVHHRPSHITAEAAKALSERCLIPSGNGFRFSTDLRYKTLVNPMLTLEHYVHLLQAIKCPCLLIVCKESVKAMDEGKLPFAIYTPNVLKIFDEFPQFKCTTISGHHDVHMNDPQAVAKLIIPFLSDTQSSL